MGNLIYRNLSFINRYYGSKLSDIEITEEDEKFIDEVEKGNIRLNIDSVFQLSEVANAHQYMEDNRAKGKVVVKT